MGTLKSLNQNLKNLTESNISNEIFRIIKLFQKEIIELNKQQLLSGKDIYGKALGFYSPTTEKITTEEYMLGKRKDIKKAGSPFNAKDTGTFFKGFYLEATQKAFKVFSRDPKTHVILDSTDWLSDDLFGLSDENLKRVIHEKILPFFLKHIRTKLGL
ncbi:hypothetical protein [Paenimyroides ceti]